MEAHVTLQRTRAAPGTGAVEPKGAPPVAEMLAQKAAEANVADVLHAGLGRVDEAATAGDPPIAELAVLRGSKRLVEAARLLEALSGKGDVVRGEEPRALWVVVVVRVDEVDDQLAPARERVSGKAVDGAAADGGFAVPPEPGGERAEPARLGPAVVVGERDVLPLRPPDARVAGSGRPRSVLDDESHVEAVAIAGDDPVERDPAVVIDDDHLQGVARGVEPGERLQTQRERCRAR